MNRNQNSHFARAPHANIQRSRFDMSHSVTTTINAGKLVPFEVREILPGDTFEVDTAILARMQTLTVPIMSDLYLDTYYFFVPNRFLWKHWQEFCGESPEPWYDDTVYSIPTIEVDVAAGADPSSNTAAVKPKTVADYLGMPLPNPGTYTVAKMDTFNHLPFRAYVKVWNDWFRSEVVSGLATYNTEDTSVTMNNVGDAFYGGELLPVMKYRDYFTAALPQPQKGPQVEIGIGEVAPVFTTSNSHSAEVLAHGETAPAALRWQSTDGDPIGSSNNQSYALFAHQNSSTSKDALTWITNTNTSVSNHDLGVVSNLWADISAATGISINDLRIAFATQRMYESMARSGSRYVELLEGMFGVSNGDLRMNRPEYLGGNRVAININQAVQNSETGSTPLGNIGAYSLTTDNQSSFTKSFTEHGWLLGLMCVRYPHFYSQGYDKFWMRKDFTDIYNPLFANIGEQPIENIEIYAAGTDNDHEVFGYQEAWADYRYAQNHVTGEMRPTYAQSLDFWHLGDDYNTLPSLSEGWLSEDANIIDRTLAVSSNVSDQFLVDIYIKMWATRPMPLFSVPGLDVM